MRTLSDLLNESDLHLLALREAMARCPQPLTEDHFVTRNPALVAALDQFAYRFTKLQDVMSAQLFRRFALDVLHEPQERYAGRMAWRVSCVLMISCRWATG